MNTVELKIGRNERENYIVTLFETSDLDNTVRGIKIAEAESEERALHSALDLVISLREDLARLLVKSVTDYR